MKHRVKLNLKDNPLHVLGLGISGLSIGTILDGEYGLLTIRPLKNTKKPGEKYLNKDVVKGGKESYVFFATPEAAQNLSTDIMRMALDMQLERTKNMKKPKRLRRKK